ncbi:uncharacterized protein LOC127526977 [Erpetoichthys calabaricus]|uniref:uncharacterized protein LOC127526977 n=1 Tax=Erpetoichthys calabaricus TaxID=27687 RepID=UPI002234073F|nr:uncharacterized protein LOC127526977 [Erpetoichthys calabaricus]
MSNEMEQVKTTLNLATHTADLSDRFDGLKFCRFSPLFASHVGQLLTEWAVSGHVAHPVLDELLVFGLLSIRHVLIALLPSFLIQGFTLDHQPLSPSYKGSAALMWLWTPPPTSMGAPPQTPQSTPPLIQQTTPPPNTMGAPPQTLQSTPPLIQQTTPPPNTMGAPPQTPQSTPPLTQQMTPPLTTMGAPPPNSTSHPILIPTITGISPAGGAPPPTSILVT